MPTCVPQLRTITLGGAVTGLGIESASFYGTPHESVVEMDILTGAGEILTVSGRADDPNRDLFGNSRKSTACSATRCACASLARAHPCPYVLLRHVCFATAEAMTDAMRQIASAREFEGRRVDFLDGTVF